MNSKVKRTVFGIFSSIAMGLIGWGMLSQEQMAFGKITIAIALLSLFQFIIQYFIEK